jgi:ABC-type transport system involved in multi-copper enzyme maturation permease subunit
VNLLTGAQTGLGLNPWPTWDVNYFNIDPWVTPLFATLNLIGGMVFLSVPFICIVYWNNIWNTAYLPMNTSALFDNTGSPYNVSRILNSDFTLDTEAYINYSQPYQVS